MKRLIDFVKEWKASIIGACILITIIGFVIFAFEIEKKRVVCTVVTHNIVGDRAGNIEYYTLCECEDGTIRSKHGMKYYVLEKGSSFYHYCEEIKWSDDFKQIFRSL